MKHKQWQNQSSKNLFQFLIVLIMAVFLISCKNDLHRESLAEIDSVYFTDSICITNYRIIDSGEGDIEHGICFSQNPNSSILNDTSHAVSNNNNVFSAIISNYFPGDTIYVRPFTKDIHGIHYGSEIRYSSLNPEIKIQSLFQTDVDSIAVLFNVSDTSILNALNVFWSENLLINSESGTIKPVSIISKNNQYQLKIAIPQLNQQYYYKLFTTEGLNQFSSNVVSYAANGMRIFYNPLNSANQLLNNIPYSSITQLAYDTNLWGEALITECNNSRGLYINHDMNEGWLDSDGANFFAIDNNQTGLNSSKGSIQFVFEFRMDTTINSDAYFFNTADSLSGRLTETGYHNNISLSAGYQGKSFNNPDKRFFFQIDDGFTNKTHRLTIAINNSQFEQVSTFSDKTVRQFSFVWDINGIHNSEETMQLFIDGIKVAAANTKWSAAKNLDNYLYLGATPAYEEHRTHILHAVNGVFDDFDIYNFAIDVQRFTNE